MRKYSQTTTPKSRKADAARVRLLRDKLPRLRAEAKAAGTVESDAGRALDSADAEIEALAGGR